MEEQPRRRAPDRPYYHHEEEETSCSHYKKTVKYDQIHFQQQETHKKKTGNGKINPSDVEGVRIQCHPACTPHTTTNNVNRHLTNANARHKSTYKVSSSAPPASGSLQTKTMTSDDKSRVLDVHHAEGQEANDSESLQNGELNPVYITNGFSGDPAPDLDGSGSEGGYTTPKRRRGGKNSIKNCEAGRDRNTEQDHGGTSAESEASSPEASLPGASLPGASLPGASHPGASNSGASHPGASPRPYGTKPAHKVDLHTLPRRTSAPDDMRAEPQRKDSDSKTAGASGKKSEERFKAPPSSSSKEDSWTLFKPPPVFPVDNSSAKIVPKISYASKVKENLNKTSQAGVEALVPPAPVRLTQVPMSAMKTITSASFTNGPLSGDGNGVSSAGTFFASAASSIPSSLTLPCGENVASCSPDSNCSSSNHPAAAFEGRKCSLFIPLNPLNMQPVLPSARQGIVSSAQSHQKVLGEIFHNQWGLSFINEPNMGAEGGGQQRGEGKAVPVTFQGECTVTTDQPLPDPLSPSTQPASGALDLDRRTSTSGGAPGALVPVPGAREDGVSLHHAGQDKWKSEDKSLASASCKHTAAESVHLSPPSWGSGGSKDQPRPRSLDTRASWGPFDLKDAVSYHIKEMGSILSLQKQDPNRVVIYAESQRGPDQ